MKIKRALVWPEFFMPSTVKAISNENDVEKQSLKSVFLERTWENRLTQKFTKTAPLKQ